MSTPSNETSNSGVRTGPDRGNLNPSDNQNKRPRFNRDSATSGPQYVQVTLSWQSRLDAASAYTPTSTTEDGKRFTEILSSAVKSNEAHQGMAVMIPADDANENESLDGDWGATSNFVFALLQENPMSSTTRVTTIGYLHTPVDSQLQPSQNIVFKTPDSFMTPLDLNKIAVKTMVSHIKSEELTRLHG
jgi:hypothetical protein